MSITIKQLMETGEKTPHVEFTGPNKIWTEKGDIYRLRDLTTQVPKLENAIYTLEVDIFGYYLQRIENKFEFDHKIYGLETSFVDRVCKTFNATKSNLGVLLNGVKGTGKTVTAKIICNKLNQPVILVTKPIAECHFFLNGIPQDITIFIDEFEKVFAKDKDNSADMLTIMDGALNSEHRRMFVLTTNNLHVNENLIQRPGRIRYLVTFSDLHHSVIEEIVDDRLIHKSLKDETIKFISNLEIITVDIVNSIIDEVNIHEEAPDKFKAVFNVKKISGKYNILLVNEQDASTTELKKNVDIWPRKIDTSGDDLVGNQFQAGGETLGVITEVIAKGVFRIQPNPVKTSVKTRTTRKIVADEHSPIEEGKVKAKAPKVVIPPSYIIRVEDADITNWKYKYGQSASNGIPTAWM